MRAFNHIVFVEFWMTPPVFFGSTQHSSFFLVGSQLFLTSDIAVRSNEGLEIFEPEHDLEPENHVPLMLFCFFCSLPGFWNLENSELRFSRAFCGEPKTPVFCGEPCPVSTGLLGARLVT